MYVPANPPLPVPEEPEEGISLGASALKNGNREASFEAVSRSLEVTKEKSSEVWTMISKLTDENSSALQQNWLLQQELELLKKYSGKNQAGGFSMLLVLLVGLTGVLVGYFLKRL